MNGLVGYEWTRSFDLKLKWGELKAYTMQVGSNQI